MDSAVELPHSLTDKQKSFMRSDSRYTIYSGAVRGGKTLALLYRSLRCARPGTRGLLGVYTYPMIQDIILPELFNIMQAYPIGSWYYSKSERNVYIKHPHSKGEAVILIRHLEDEGKLQGKSLDWYCIDEATVGVSQAVFHQLNARLSRGERQYASIATNPGPKTHYLYDYFFNAPADKRNDRTIIRAKMTDNPHLPQDYVDDMLSRPDSWKRRFVDGEWGAYEGIIFDNFDPERHLFDGNEPPGCEYYLAIDFGYTNPFACLLIAMSANRNVYVLDEYFKREQTIPKHAEYLKEHFLSRYEIRGYVVDPAAASDRAELETQLRKRTIYAAKHVMHGIQCVKEKLQSGTLLISRRCTNLIAEFESYEWASSPDGKPTKEEPRKINDHGLDALRYFCYTLANTKQIGVRAGAD